jgi:hypothetical protein
MKNTLILITLALTFTACSGGGTSTPTAPACTIQSVSLSPNPAQLEKGKNLQLTATPTVGPDGCVGTPSNTAIWTSSDPSKVSVSEQGMLTGVLETGATPVTVTATVGGKSATSSVNVGVPVNPNKTVTVNVSNSDGLKFIAYQDGDGPWQLLEKKDIQTLTISSGRYGVATVCDYNGYVNRIELGYATSGNMYRYCNSTNTNPTTPPSQIIKLNVKGGVTGKYARVGIGYYGTGGTILADGTINTGSGFSVPRGTVDLFVAQNNIDSNANFSSIGKLEKLIVRRDYQVDSNKTETLDLSGPEVVQLGSSTVSLEGVRSSETATMNAYFRLARSYDFTLNYTRGTSMDFPTLPSSILKPNDYYYVNGYTNDSTSNISRSVAYYSWGGNVNIPNNRLVLPQLFSSPVLQIFSVQPYFQPTFRWSAYPNANSYYFYLSNGNLKKEIYISMSAQYTAGLSSYTLPDFSNMSGWKNEWAFQSGQAISWNMGASSNGGTNIYANSSKYGSFTP